MLSLAIAVDINRNNNSIIETNSGDRLVYQNGHRIVNPKLYRIETEAGPVILLTSKRWPVTLVERWF